MPKLKTKKFVPKLWASCNDQIGAPKNHQKNNALSEAKSNGKLRNQHWKYKPKSLTDKKNMVKLVLQNKQIYILKSHKFASTKNTVVKSPKHEITFTRNFLMTQNTLYCIICISKLRNFLCDWYLDRLTSIRIKIMVTDFFYFHQNMSYHSDSFWKIFISHYFETITALSIETPHISLYKTSVTSTYTVTLVKFTYDPCYYPAITSYYSAITWKSENKKILYGDRYYAKCKLLWCSLWFGGLNTTWHAWEKMPSKWWSKAAKHHKF